MSYVSYFWGKVETKTVEPYQALHWFLRIACAMCFIGHGAWGVITKAGWLPFFATFGIPESIAWKLMPLIGTMDIALGISILIFPTKLTLVWMSFWTIWTALIRPLSGMGWWEFLERAGNYGPPIAFLIIATMTYENLGWFQRIEARKLSAEAMKRVSFVLRASIALLLIGHGGFGAFQVKPMLIEHYSSLGFAATPGLVQAIGWGEILAGIAVFFLPLKGFLLAILYWKVGTELLYPIAGSFIDTWEWIERGGDYFAPVALIAVLYMIQTAGFETQKVKAKKLSTKKVATV